MKLRFTGTNVALAVAVAAGFAAVTGCSSEHRTARYWASPGYESASTTTRTTTTQTQTAQADTDENSGRQQNSGQLSMTGGTNSVIPLYKEDLDVGKREVDAGTVRVKKIVKTETVNQPVELRHEEVVIDRQPASATASTAPDNAFQEQETVIHLKKEEPVVQKRVASAGQVVVQARSQEEQQNIHEQIRSEDVAVDKGNAQNVTIEGNIQQQNGEAMGSAESPSGEASGHSENGGEITDPMMLSSGNVSTLSGRPVQFSSLRVQNVESDRLAKCDAGNGKSIYIHAGQNAGTLRAGESIDVQGVVKTGPADVGGTEAQTLSSQPAYIEAQKIEPARQ